VDRGHRGREGLFECSRSHQRGAAICAAITVCARISCIKSVFHILLSSCFRTPHYVLVSVAALLSVVMTATITHISINDVTLCAEILSKSLRRGTRVQDGGYRDSTSGKGDKENRQEGFRRRR
jgi:hypothetical protein